MEAEVVVAVDEFIPQAGVPAAADRLQLQRGQGMGGCMDGVLRAGFGAGLHARLRALATRGRQLDQAVLLHAQHGHPAGHLLQPLTSVGFLTLSLPPCKMSNLVH